MAQRTKRRRRGTAPRRKGGVMIGMRRGFKKAATSVVGGEQSPSKRRSWLSTAFSVLLVIAALAFLLYRWQ
jgi:hypothetical protein